MILLMNEDVSCNKHPLFSSLIQVAVDLDRGCYGLLLPIDSGFLADKLQPFLAGFAVKTTAVDQGDFSVSLFLWTNVASSLFTLCDCIYLLVQKKKLKYSIDLSVLKKLLSKHVTNVWLASKMTNSNRWFE